MLRFLGSLFKTTNITNQEHTATLTALENTLTQLKTDADQTKVEIMILTSSGMWLDAWGSWFGVTRQNGEIDEFYRNRILAVASKPKNTIPALISTTQTFIGDPTADVRVYEPYNNVRKFNLSTFSGPDKYQDAVYYRTATVDILIPTRVLDAKGLNGTIERVKSAGIKAYFTLMTALDDDAVSGVQDNLNPDGEILREIELTADGNSDRVAIYSGLSLGYGRSGQQILFPGYDRELSVGDGGEYVSWRDSFYAGSDIQIGNYLDVKITDMNSVNNWYEPPILSESTFS